MRLAQILTWLNAALDDKPVPGVSREALQRLLDYVESWRECAPNGIVWRDRFPNYWKAVCRSLEQTQLILYPAIDGFIPAWDVRQGIAQSDIWRVDKLFADFLAGRAKIAACQREACGRYFEQTLKRTTYCSDRCGKMATSQAAKSAARHNERHRRMLLVLTTLRKLSKSKFEQFLIADETQERPAWTDYVIREVPAVTDRWLNEAILRRLETPENFGNCARCAEIREQIWVFLESKGGALK